MNRRSNKEKYQKSFQALHLSDDFQERFEKRLEEEREGKNMNSNGIYGISRAAAVIAACVVAFGSLGICYAADVGEIRTTVEMWINGSKQEVELEQVNETEYRWTDEGGEEHRMGGVMKEADGSERPMSADELVFRKHIDPYEPLCFGFTMPLCLILNNGLFLIQRLPY